MKKVKTGDILQYSMYRISDCTDFRDIANTLEHIFCNCRKYDTVIFNNPAVYNRVMGLARLCRSNLHFQKKEDIAWAKVECSYFNDIMETVNNLGKNGI